jgi:mannitol/fructose-specific phosphotransferase system IIA component (Ntr-type)
MELLNKEQKENLYPKWGRKHPKKKERRKSLKNNLIIKTIELNYEKTFTYFIASLAVPHVVPIHKKSEKFTVKTLEGTIANKDPQSLPDCLM